MANVTVNGKVFKTQKEGDGEVTDDRADINKTMETREEAEKRITEQIKKINADNIKTLAQASVVPLGLAFYAYHNKFSLIKGLVVVIGGSFIALVGVVAYGFRSK